MAKQLDEDELQGILDATKPKLGVGRPKKPSTRLEVMSIPLSKETILHIQKLAAERGIRPGAMGRELILLGLGALNGRASTT
jgi:hypothetical protein